MAGSSVWVHSRCLVLLRVGSGSLRWTTLRYGFDSVACALQRALYAALRLLCQQRVPYAPRVRAVAFTLRLSCSSACWLPLGWFGYALDLVLCHCLVALCAGYAVTAFDGRQQTGSAFLPSFSWVALFWNSGSSFALLYART